MKDINIFSSEHLELICNSEGHLVSNLNVNEDIMTVQYFVARWLYS